MLYGRAYFINSISEEDDEESRKESILFYDNSFQELFSIIIEDIELLHPDWETIKQERWNKHKESIYYPAAAAAA